jgi:hypothetical protein
MPDRLLREQRVSREGIHRFGVTRPVWKRHRSLATRPDEWSPSMSEESMEVVVLTHQTSLVRSAQHSSAKLGWRTDPFCCCERNHSPRKFYLHCNSRAKREKKEVRSGVRVGWRARRRRSTWRRSCRPSTATSSRSPMATPRSCNSTLRRNIKVCDTSEHLSSQSRGSDPQVAAGTSEFEKRKYEATNCER